MQKQLAVLSLSEVCQDTVLHLLSSLYPTHRKITAGVHQASHTWIESVLDLENEQGEALKVSFYHGHVSVITSDSHRVQWQSGSGQHDVAELHSIDTAILAVDGSLCRLCQADSSMLETAAGELMGLGIHTLLAVVNCHPALRSFDCTGLPAKIAIENVHMLPFSLFAVFPDRLDLTSELLRPAAIQDWTRVSTAVRALLCAAADFHAGSEDGLSSAAAAGPSGSHQADPLSNCTSSNSLHQTDERQEVRPRSRPQPGSSAATLPHTSLTYSSQEMKGSKNHKDQPGHNKEYTVGPNQVKDLGRVYGPSGKYIAEMERLSDTVITLPPMSARLPGVTVTINLASADAACNAQARSMIRAALRGLPWLDIPR